MCGIVGMIAKWGGGFNTNHSDVFEELLYADGLRGMDSTGVFGVTKKNQVNVLKQAVNPGLFTMSKGWKSWKSDIWNKMFICVGHNRKATVGDIVSKTAHPFVVGNITLVHNGFISNWKELDQGTENPATVDSEAVAKMFNRTPDVEKALKSLHGAYALAWYDHSKKRVFLARNSDRPLFFAWNQGTIFIASEDDMLLWILKRNRIAIDGYQIVPINSYVEIKIDSFKMDVHRFEKPTSTVWNGDGMDMRNLGEGYPYEERAEEDDVTVQPELSRIRQEAEEESTAIAAKEMGQKPELTEARILIRDAFKIYHEEQKVCFWVKGYHPAGKDKYDDPRIELFGDMWMPGNKSYPAICNVSAKEKDAIYINNDSPLIGTICALHKKPSTNELRWVLTKVHKPSQYVKDHIGTKISLFEWNAIVEWLQCDKCKTALKTWQPEFCSVTRIPSEKGRYVGAYKLICAKCITFPKIASLDDAKVVEPLPQTDVNIDDNRAEGG